MLESKTDAQLQTEQKGPEPHLRRFGIFVLGAGFSRPAGLPLARELWAEVLRRTKSAAGRAALFRDDLKSYIKFRKKCDGRILTAEDIDFEDFMAFLDIEHFLGLRGSDTWSEDGNEGQVVVKTLIGEILTERTPPADKVPELYLRFAELLQPDDYVLTFNYDVLLERALEAIGKPFRLFPDRFRQVGETIGEVDDSREEVVVLKLHGSVDWFDRRGYRILEEHRVRSALAPGHFHPVFGPGQNIRSIPVLDGPRFPADPLTEMYRVIDVEQLYKKRILFEATPSLLNPSPRKIIYSEKLREFWYGLGQAGGANFGMAIIGFSLSWEDDYARQVIYRLVTNYQQLYWNKGFLGRRKTPLVLVDCRKSTKEKGALKRRYAFVNWDRAKVHFGGFDPDALNLLRQTYQV